jgi:predicted nucleic-acid-binding Zn-ribbon protein
MKNKGICVKCGSTEIVRFDGYCGAYGTGNNLMTGKSIFSTVNVNRYVCLGCGYTEEWIDTDDLDAVRASKKAIPQNEE